MKCFYAIHHPWILDKSNSCNLHWNFHAHYTRMLIVALFPSKANLQVSLIGTAIVSLFYYIELPIEIFSKPLDDILQGLPSAS